MTVILDVHTAATGGHDNRLGLGFKMRPPGVDVAARLRQALLLPGGMMTDGAATTGAGAGDGDQGNAQPVQHARGGGVDAGRDGRLHATFQDQHATRMYYTRPRDAALIGWNVAFE